MEADPYSTSYAEPRLSESVSRTAAKRLRKQSEGRGNRARRDIEGKAPAWRNEGSEKTSTPPKGSSTAFQPGSFSGGLHFNLKKNGKAY